MLLTSSLNKPPAWDSLFVLFPSLKDIVSSLFFGKTSIASSKKLIFDHNWELVAGNQISE